MATAAEIRKRAQANRRKKKATASKSEKVFPARRTASQSGRPPGTSRVRVREAPSTGEKVTALASTALKLAKQPNASIPQSQQFANAKRGGRIQSSRAKRKRNRRSATVKRRKR